ncbi:MAG: hypothetical protein PHO01_08170 [Desulfotomaculaceae bacterium]|nr:hypothetical protein [Desulfotomaculaceae bacterium]
MADFENHLLTQASLHVKGCLVGPICHTLPMFLVCAFLDFFRGCRRRDLPPAGTEAKSLIENAGRDELRKRIADMSAFLQQQPTAITDYDEQLIRRLIEKVTIYEDKFTVEFKSGVKVDVEE